MKIRISRPTRLRIGPFALVAIAFLFVACLIWAKSPAAKRERVTSTEFRALMNTIADAWNSGDARKAAECYTEDAVYTEPPDRQVHVGRDNLFQFFGGNEKPESPMHMQWHNLAFDEESQLGFGEYTFQMTNRYHGIVVVRLRDGKISNWREYQYKSDLTWPQFKI